MRFVPYVYTKDYEQVPVVIKPMSESDAEQTNQTPVWQSSWTSDYLNDDRLEKYAVKKDDELIGLGAYEINDDALIVHIVYIESHPESNPTIVGDERKFHGIGRLLIAYGTSSRSTMALTEMLCWRQRLLNLHDTMSKTMARLVYRHLVPVHHGF